MKILFWVLAIVSIPIGWFMTAVSVMSHGLGLSGTGIGEVVCVAGMFSIGVSIICMVLGIIKLRKGKVKKAVVFALVGVLYSGIILGGMYIDDAVHTIRMERDIAAWDNQMYGEGWDAAPAIEGIPELYQEILNKAYVVVRDKWPSDRMMDLPLTAMVEHYGEEPLENIGFLLMDVNGNGNQELLIGSTASAEEGGTVIFTMYSDPENPFISLRSLEGEIYYLHAGEADGTYVAEIGGADAAWLLGAEEGEGIVDICYQEGAMDPAGRLTLELIPFSKYK